MSTFGGFMPEFPQIRVDFFRQIRGLPPPLACFVSHVHSDHLAGLESLRSPFVYCSAATKSILLRLERYPHRINFERGILESRKQHFKHLRNLLKPIPLLTPTRIELMPGNDIQVTLFDANHCIGAVMFLIEGDGRAVLYTGDIRAEPWFVNALARNPCLIEYTSCLKVLDCIYLDTSFTEDIAFPTKAEGLAELLHKVSKYPPTAEFHFAAWTFGYEEVWMALSRALKSQIHVDNYKMKLYDSLCDNVDRFHKTYLAPEAPMLAGYMVGNSEHPGILTVDHRVRVHSCEKGIKCNHLGDQTVWIKPIIARTPSGQVIAEMGVGGGGGDLNQRPEVELDNDAMIMQLMKIFAEKKDASVLNSIRSLLVAGLNSSRKALVLDAQYDCKLEDLSLEDLTTILARSAAQQPVDLDVISVEGDAQLPNIITFPYSRHSSYSELRTLVGAFKPMDVYPCTVDEAKWHEGVSMRALFGDLCSSSIFRHDQEMYETISDLRNDETQKSCNIGGRSDSQSSSENAEYQSCVHDDHDYEKLSKAHISRTAPEAETMDAMPSQDLLRGSESRRQETRSLQCITEPEGKPERSCKRACTRELSEDEYDLSCLNKNSPLETKFYEHTVTNSSTGDSSKSKGKITKLSSAHDNLKQENDELVNDQTTSRHDMLASDPYHSTGLDEPYFNTMNAELHDSPLLEDLLSHVQGDSQSSIVSIQRLRTRVDAFHAARENWHNISLMSTGDNHTEESQEL